MSICERFCFVSYTKYKNPLNNRSKKHQVCLRLSKKREKVQPYLKEYILPFNDIHEVAKSPLIVRLHALAGINVSLSPVNTPSIGL